MTGIIFWVRNGVNLSWLEKRINEIIQHTKNQTLKTRIYHSKHETFHLFGLNTLIHNLTSNIFSFTILTFNILSILVQHNTDLQQKLHKNIIIRSRSSTETSENIQGTVKKTKKSTVKSPKTLNNTTKLVTRQRSFSEQTGALRYPDECEISVVKIGWRVGWNTDGFKKNFFCKSK